MHGITFEAFQNERKNIATASSDKEWLSRCVVVMRLNMCVQSQAKPNKEKKPNKKHQIHAQIDGIYTAFRCALPCKSFNKTGQFHKYGMKVFNRIKIRNKNITRPAMSHRANIETVVNVCVVRWGTNK